MSIDNPTGGGSGTVTSVIAGTGLAGGTITSTGTISLPATGVSAGSYTLASLTVDAEGRLTAAADGSAGSGTVTSIVAASPLSGGTITSTGTIGLPNTTVAADSYTLASLTVDAQGRLTAASNGAAVTSLVAGTGLSGGTITSTGTISLPATGVSAGSYTSTNLTVDAEGRITAAANGSGGTYAHNQNRITLSHAATNVPTMAGQGLTITPSATGKVLVIFAGTLNTSSGTAVGDGLVWSMVYGTGTPPSAGDNGTGTAPSPGPIQSHTNSNSVTIADVNVPWSMQALITGLTIGIAYWIDMQVYYLGAAGYTLGTTMANAVELP